MIKTSLRMSVDAGPMRPPLKHACMVYNFTLPVQEDTSDENH